MTMDTYTLVVRETSTHDGIDADITNEDGLVENSTQVTYSDYDVAAERDDGGPDRIEEEFTVDARSIEIHLERDEREFAFRVLADDEAVASVTVSDDDWELQHT